MPKRQHAADMARSGRRVVARGRQRSLIRRYLATTSVPKLHLGSGHNHLAGWLNTDRDVDAHHVFLDAARPFPLPDGAVDYVFAEHLIEHLPYADAVGMLHECHRVLTAGGRIRLATPDLGTLVSLLRDGRGDVGRRYAGWLCESYFPDAHGPAATFAVNQVLRGWGHRFVHDEATLRATLEGTGFVDVERHGFGDSATPELKGLERHGVDDGNEGFSRFETMVLEAAR